MLQTSSIQIQEPKLRKIYGNYASGFINGWPKFEHILFRPVRIKTFQCIKRFPQFFLMVSSHTVAYKPPPISNCGNHSLVRNLLRVLLENSLHSSVEASAQLQSPSFFCCCRWASMKPMFMGLVKLASWRIFIPFYCEKAIKEWTIECARLNLRYGYEGESWTICTHESFCQGSCYCNIILWQIPSRMNRKNINRVR